MMARRASEATKRDPREPQDLPRESQELPSEPVNLDSERAGKHKTWLEAGCKGEETLLKMQAKQERKTQARKENEVTPMIC